MREIQSVYVIILNYNHLEDLKETVYSFIKQDYPNLHLIVSDNKSTDDSLIWLRDNFNDIIILENNQNFGWAEGNNIGIRYAIEQNADFILLANNDLFFDDPTVISKLVSSFDTIPHLGIIGPNENSYHNRSVIFNEGWILFPKTKFIFNTVRTKITFDSKLLDFNIVDNVSGSFMLVKCEVFKDIGLMDSNLFLYAEDADFSLRAWKNGWISAINKKLTIYHKISATAGNDSPLKIYYKTRNLIYLIRKHKFLQENHCYFIYRYYFDFIKNTLKLFLLNRYRIDRYNKLKAHFLGFYHGTILKRFGKYY